MRLSSNLDKTSSLTSGSLNDASGMIPVVNEVDFNVNCVHRNKRRLQLLLIRVNWIKDEFKRLEVDGKSANNIGQRMVERIKRVDMGDHRLGC
jgi:hypothetical protein